MFARIGNPAAALLDPILVGLRLSVGEADMIENKDDRPSLSFAVDGFDEGPLTRPPIG
jgi:hypothetical protein